MTVVDHPAPDDRAEPVAPDVPAVDDDTVLRRGMALLWRSVREHPVPFAVSVVGATVFAVMTVASTVVLGRVTDELVVPGLADDRGPGTFGDVEAGTVLLVTGAVVVVALARAMGVIARRFFCAVTTFRMGATWRGRLAERYLAAPLRFHTRRPAGELMAHADDDAVKAIEFINPAPFSMSAFVIGAVAFARLVAVDWVIALVAITVFPALLVMNRAYTARVEAPAARGQARYGDMAAVAHESFDGALVVKVLGLGDHEEARFARATDALRQERVRVGELRAWFEPGLNALPNLGSVIVLGLGAWRLSTGDLTEGGIVEALALFAVLATPMRVMGYLLQSMPPSVVAADRLDGVLEVDDDERHPARGTATLPAGPLGVEARDLSFAHDPEAPVLEDVSLSIRPGEVVALTGATAGGKTSLCLCLAGLLEPTGGAVALGGVDVRDLAPDQLPSSVGFVFQETFLFADTVEANVRAGLGRDEVGDDEVARALALARADGFVTALPEGLGSVLGERGVTLSGGQRQRLALARALVRRPRLLVLDDATSAIDPVVEAEILGGLGRALDTTTVVVAHRVSTIRLADRVVFLDGGRVAAVGPHDQLLATVPAYAALVEVYEGEGM
ncbi:ABC transporter ATP-binding protein [Iamia majanohamensis]|uniref:ABC transporter ATP-binding protein n=1 Tax=Iamia majanohamensis TaxID=467976 RepID=A0AAF0BRD2_9ACTN|nr:ABC transporter ATP-binding protein [Iamia majanohamensis]WCO66456.1 ABC transporter ATP-binding protein [Iamia majanohamensis]